MLLHGWAADSRIWNGLLGAYGEQISLVAPDLPGHGATPLHLDGEPLDAYHSHAVDSFCSWSEDQGLIDAPILSWAWGTWVAIDAVASGRVQPRSMMLISFAPGADSPVPYDGPVARDWPRYAHTIVRMMVGAVISPETEDWLSTIMRETSPAAAAGVHLAAWRAPDATFRLPLDSVVVLGENDRIQPGRDGATVAEAWGVNTVTSIAGSGHTAFIEERTRFDDVWRAWLADIGVLH